MTIEDVADYCELMDCAVSLGNPDIGFVAVDGRGVRGKFNNYRRFLQLNELASLPDPVKVLEGASVFRIEDDDGTRTLDRVEFERELRRFRQLIGV